MPSSQPKVKHSQRSKAWYERQISADVLGSVPGTSGALHEHDTMTLQQFLEVRENTPSLSPSERLR